MDATVVFDHVLVPWERVFLHENIALLNRMYRDTRMRELTAHQTNARLEVKLSFLYAVCVRLAEASGLDARADIQEALGEAAVRVSLAEFDSPIGADLERSLSGAGLSGRDKARLFKLVWDLVGTEFGARHELYEMNYAGERGALVAGVHREYSRRPQYLAALDRFLR
jgi:aromatic ring hydroxylase